MKIAQYLDSQSWGDVNPETLQKGLGGRETAMVHLGEEWAKRGHDVTNFVKTKESKKFGANYVTNKITGDYLSNFDVDVLIAWEEPRIFGAEQIRKHVKLGIIEMQVAHLDTSDELDKATDSYAVLSNWAGEFLLMQGVDEKKIIVFPNGVDMDRYKSPKTGFPDPPYDFYYSSSPDRGLHHLLRIWPRITERWPGSHLHICYGLEKWLEMAKWSHNIQCEAALDIQEGLTQNGVIYHGKIGQTALARLQSKSDALLYPCDPMQPTETGCITVIEAGAAGTPAIITDADCLKSEFSDTAEVVALPFNDDRYFDAIVGVMENEERYLDLQKAGRKLAEQRSWGKIAERWLDFFEEVV